MCSQHLTWDLEGLLTSSRSWSGYHHHGPPGGSPASCLELCWHRLTILPPVWSLHTSPPTGTGKHSQLSFDLCPTVVLEIFSFLFTFPPLQLLGTSIERLGGTSGPFLPALGRAGFWKCCLSVQPDCDVLFPGMTPHLQWGTSYLGAVSCKISNGQWVSGLPLQISIPLLI